MKHTTLLASLLVSLLTSATVGATVKRGGPPAPPPPSAEEIAGTKPLAGAKKGGPVPPPPPVFPKSPLKPISPVHHPAHTTVTASTSHLTTLAEALKALLSHVGASHGGHTSASTPVTPPAPTAEGDQSIILQAAGKNTYTLPTIPAEVSGKVLYKIKDALSSLQKFYANMNTTSRMKRIMQQEKTSADTAINAIPSKTPDLAAAGIKEKALQVQIQNFKSNLSQILVNMIDNA